MAWMTSAVPRTRARAPAHQMKIGRRSASHDDHPNLCVAGSTACDTRSATAEPVPQRRRDEPADGSDPLWQAVRALPPQQRAAVAHRFLLDMTYADVAEAMGTTEEAARANVYQGLKRLRERTRSEHAVQD